MSHKWEFRPPPPHDTDLALCQYLQHCRLGDLCPCAHSPRELAEWKKRKSELVKAQLDAGSYSDKILKSVLSESSSAPPTTKEMSGVKVVIDQNETLKFSKRKSSTSWNFFLSSKFFLKGISMLEVENLQHFTISDVTRVRNGNITEIPSNLKECTIDETDTSGGTKAAGGNSSAAGGGGKAANNYHYRLKLNFETQVFGAFKQTLIFDFGTKPLLAKTVSVTVAPESAEEDLNSAKESILTSAPVWDDSNTTIVKFSPAPGPTHSDQEALMEAYPIPQPDSFTLTKVCVDKTLTAENYRERFHQLLYMEELAQYQEITGFNATLNILTTERYLMAGSVSVASTAKYARPGELFGRIDLNSELADDSKAGRLILTKCSSVLLKLYEKSSGKKVKQKGQKGAINKLKKKLQENDDRKAWECLIEDTAKSVIYVRLPSNLVSECELRKDSKLVGDIQFKLNRLALVEMHYAVDKLLNPRLVYPATSPAPTIPWSPSTQWGATLDPALNVKQKEAVLAITTPLGNKLPPILIIGPYGTGKTFTIGAALLMLLKDTVSKILVCTHSNSAADLYIKDYIHPAIERGDIDKKVLRIYYENRWVQTVHTTVQKYCLIQTDEMTAIRRFRVPTESDLLSADLVVATLSTSRTLAQLLQPGHFSHILLDEAAQALESEAIIPLILATHTTRIVLAGDHMQLEPEIVSTFAMEKRLNVSLLERLYDHYPSDHPCKILLCENYRSHQGIVDFTSQLFYDQKLVSSGKQPPHPTWYPLTFFTARGEDTQDPNSTSYYNNYEVAEIIDRLQELKEDWPQVWDHKEDVEVGVVTPYHDQVLRLRTELRKKRLSNISVERVQNVQGKQYRVIFISIVRTRDSCLSKEDEGRTDFGFLSSAKLLNTALTRAQSLVAVIGDPVTMCSVGRNRILWKRFLEICKTQDSLYGYTWDDLTNNLAAIELKTIYGLNPLAKEFVPLHQMLQTQKQRGIAAGLSMAAANSGALAAVGGSFAGVGGSFDQQHWMYQQQQRMMSPMNKSMMMTFKDYVSHGGVPPGSNLHPPPVGAAPQHAYRLPAPPPFMPGGGVGPPTNFHMMGAARGGAAAGGGGPPHSPSNSGPGSNRPLLTTPQPGGPRLPLTAAYPPPPHLITHPKTPPLYPPTAFNPAFRAAAMAAAAAVRGPSGLMPSTPPPHSGGPAGPFIPPPMRSPLLAPPPPNTPHSAMLTPHHPAHPSDTALSPAISSFGGFHFRPVAPPPAAVTPMGGGVGGAPTQTTPAAAHMLLQHQQQQQQQQSTRQVAHFIKAGVANATSSSGGGSGGADEKLPFNPAQKLENATERILPLGMDLQKIMQTREAQVSWFNLLLSVGKLQEAQAFEELILSEGGSALSAQFTKNDQSNIGEGQNILPTSERQDIVSAERRTEDMKQEPNQHNLPGLTENGENRGAEDMEKDKMQLIFEGMMADFEKDDEDNNSGSPGENEAYIPLYKRRSGGGAQHDNSPIQAGNNNNNLSNPQHQNQQHLLPLGPQQQQQIQPSNEVLLSEDDRSTRESSVLSNGGGNGPMVFQHQHLLSANGNIGVNDGMDRFGTGAMPALSAAGMILPPGNILQPTAGMMPSAFPVSSGAGVRHGSVPPGFLPTAQNNALPPAAQLAAAASLHASQNIAQTTEEQQQRELLELELILKQKLEQMQLSEARGGAGGVQPLPPAGANNGLSETGFLRGGGGEEGESQEQLSSTAYQLPTFRPATNIDWKDISNRDASSENGLLLGGGGMLDLQGSVQRVDGPGGNMVPSGGAAVPTYARVVQTTPPRDPQEEDTLTKIRNLGTYGFQNLG